MKNIPFIIKSTGEAGFPYLLEPIDCSTCNGKTLKYSSGSALLTLGIASLSFLVAFGWNSFFQAWFEEKAKNDKQLVASQLNYAFLATLVSFLIIFGLLYFIDGEKC